ncbi:putative acetyltransferase [Haloferax elongans ATCC BAA-1513]|uniref:Putative acetyltransferase n=1 Tax=Haloferax elongans ATCC BAA-1513 TaxID=1230453 RepID=M0HNB2_HALEO|nr:N-acetyltransferase [Haloferax elongans]ELZ84584.1 putative acetyltransferase [Haloferax elongans ATCC BAA-1513]
MTIRPATDADTSAILRVAERSWKHDYPDILTRETAETAALDWYTPEQIASELHKSQGQILVFNREETVVGFAHTTWNYTEREGYILRIYVDPDHRRAGIGRALLEAALSDLDEKGIDQINAMVLVANEPGNDFYEQFGFEHVDESETTIGDKSYPENRYVLERPFELAGG